MGGSLKSTKLVLGPMEEVEEEEVEELIRYLQELSAPLSSSKVTEEEVPTVSMSKNVLSSAALSMSSSAPQ